MGRLEQNQLVTASDNAIKATVAGNARHEGFLYCGIELYKQDVIGSAEQYLRQALDRAPTDRKLELRRC
jgi:hypothetical protein